MSNSITNDQQLPLYAPEGTPIPKTLHSGTDWEGQPYLYIDESTVALFSQPGKGIIVDNVFGNTLSGPTAIFEIPENIHFGGGYWAINPLMLQSIGSSAAVPMPWLVPTTPRLLSAAATVNSSVSALQAADPSMLV